MRRYAFVADSIIIALAFGLPISPSTSAAAWFKDPIGLHAAPDVFSVSSGDVNADGLRDVVAVAEDSAWVSVLLQKSHGGLEPAVNSRLRFPGTYEAGLGDFDENGRADLAAPGVNTNLLELYSGNTDATFSFSRSYQAIDQAPSATAIGDVNSDGHLDIAIANWSPAGKVGIRLGAGDGNFGTRIEFATGPGPTDVALRDLNGDGKLDAVVTCNGFSAPWSDSVAVHLGNGDGTFSIRRSYRASNRPYYVAIGDLDNNGIADLAVACSDGNISVLLGLGDGTFNPATNYPVGPTPYWVAIDDIDGDGWNDIVSTDPFDTTHPNSIAVLINLQGGTYGAPVYVDVGVTPDGLVVEDFTGDGKPDIVVSSRRLDSVYFLENCSPCTPTSIEAALLEAYFDDPGIHLRWAVSRDPGTVALVQRRSVSGSWETLADPTVLTSSVFEFVDVQVVLGERYAYRLILHSLEGSLTTPETWVEATKGALPRTLTLDRPTPNPTGGTLSVRLGLYREGPAELSVFDVRGRLVARVFNGSPSAGWHTLSWNGRDLTGRPVASGTYFLRLSAGSSLSRRFVVLR